MRLASRGPDQSFGIFGGDPARTTLRFLESPSLSRVRDVPIPFRPCVVDGRRQQPKFAVDRPRLHTILSTAVNAILLCQIACGFKNPRVAPTTSPNHLSLMEKPVRAVPTAGYRSLEIFSIPMFRLALHNVGRSQSAAANRGVAHDGMAGAPTRTMYLSACGAPHPLRSAGILQERRWRLGVQPRHEAPLVMRRGRISLRTSRRAPGPRQMTSARTPAAPARRSCIVGLNHPGQPVMPECALHTFPAW